MVITRSKHGVVNMKQYISEREFQRQMNKIKRDNEQTQKRLALKAEKDKYKAKNHIETSKLIAIYLFCLLNAIVIYAMVAMWKFGDFSYLGVLISDIAAQVLIYAIYCMKAYHAKKQSEQIKLFREKFHGDLGDILDAGGESDEPVPLTNGLVGGNTDDEEAVG